MSYSGVYLGPSCIGMHKACPGMSERDREVYERDISDRDVLFVYLKHEGVLARRNSFRHLAMARSAL